MTDSEPARPNWRGCFLFAFCMCVVVPAVLILASLTYMYFNSIPVHLDGEIKIGMTRQEVLDIAGPPHFKSPDGSWNYFMRDGLFQLRDPLCLGFDDGKLVWSSF